MRVNFNVSYFIKHLETCDGPPKSAKLSGAGMKSITSMLQQHPPVASCDSELEEPCPGLTAHNDTRIANYFEHSGAMGGGAPSVTKVAKELFGRKAVYADLSTKVKEKVQTAQMHQWKWRNDRSAGRVFSTSCKKTVGVHNPPLPCTACCQLLSLKAFKNALNVDVPDDKNFKFNNTVYQGKSHIDLYAKCSGLRWIIEAEDRNSPYICYAAGVLLGKYKGDEFFASLLEAVVMKADKESRGVGMQGFRYSPDLLEFAHIVATHSPRAYSFIKKYLPTPTPRTLARQRTQYPRPMIGIHEQAFDMVRDNLEALKYNGPVGLSCDDTKLTAAFRPYFDKERGKHYIIGNHQEIRGMPI
ncbi:hypothetical protein Hypma_009977 [Hypsizygus marmoreus]|uniref:THAP9-like helix-turn-helix domain-containing protein n=1 Tax=Hypsizygus marmoreus TaxID=39966 RepID=A0A369JTQ8_HYPMA|nr:hypothetical protein Hypma_009977 [Hypsizygus marmoreus]